MLPAALLAWSRRLPLEVEDHPIIILRPQHLAEMIVAMHADGRVPCHRAKSLEALAKLGLPRDHSLHVYASCRVVDLQGNKLLQRLLQQACGFPDETVDRRLGQGFRYERWISAG